MITCLRNNGITVAPLSGRSLRNLTRYFSTSIARHTIAPYAKILYQQTSSQTVKPATESDFFNYTSKRWLFNESYELSRRFVQFDIQCLFDTAVAAVGDGATKCIRATKLREGQHSKAFLLVMDNGTEVVAKLPNPNAGPAHYTTASEVATMNWVRVVLNIPVPAILAWSSDTTNAVGTEYIIMEKANGVLLSDIWYQLKREAKSKIIQQVVDLQVLLGSRPSTAHGCLFYRDDIHQDLSCSSEASDHLGPDVTIGPLVHPALWDDGRTELNVWKGPWLNMSTYATDLGRNEREWVLRNAKPRMNDFRDRDAPEQPAEMLDLLGKYLTVAPHISQCPPDLADLERPFLSHPDLNLSNLFVDPATNTITSIIDWQGAAFTPLAMQAKIPRMVRHPEPLDIGLVMPKRPSNYDELDAAARKAADVLYQSALCQKYYEVLLAKKHPRFYGAIIDNMSFHLPHVEPLRLVCGSWKDRDIHKLRSSLIQVANNWSLLGTSLPSCPISFSKEEVQRHDEELDNIDYIESLMEGFQNEGILPADGRVQLEDYEVLMKVNSIQKEAYLSHAKDAEEARIMERTWPWQDWPERSGK